MNAPEQGELWEATRGDFFANPSMAAMALMGRSANSWLEWKSPQGRTLDEVKRQSVTGAG
jgi:hypothetical protein